MTTKVLSEFKRMLENTTQNLSKISTNSWKTKLKFSSTGKKTKKEKSQQDAEI